MAEGKEGYYFLDCISPNPGGEGSLSVTMASPFAADVPLRLDVPDYQNIEITFPITPETFEYSILATSGTYKMIVGSK